MRKLASEVKEIYEKKLTRLTFNPKFFDINF